MPDTYFYDHAFMNQQLEEVTNQVYRVLAAGNIKLKTADVLLAGIAAAGDAYHEQLLTGLLEVKAIMGLVHNLSTTAESFGITETIFMEIAKVCMQAGYHAGLFGVWIDYALAASNDEV